MQQYSIPGLTEKKNTFPWFSCWWTQILGLFYLKNLEHKCLLSMSSSKNLQLETVPTFWPHAQRLMMTLRKVELNLDKDPNFGNIFTLPWLAQQASSWYLSSTKISQEANFLVLHISCLKKTDNWKTMEWIVLLMLECRSCLILYQLLLLKDETNEKMVSVRDMNNWVIQVGGLRILHVWGIVRESTVSCQILNLTDLEPDYWGGSEELLSFLCECFNHYLNCEYSCPVHILLKGN